MRTDPALPPPPIAIEDLVVNVRGVLLAAYLPIETTAAILRCSAAEAEAFAMRAQHHTIALNSAVSRARQ